jgi:hypothetical protein
VSPQVIAVAAVSCPVTATEVWNTLASSTKRGPNISQTVIARKLAAARKTSSTAEGKADVAILDSVWMEDFTVTCRLVPTVPRPISDSSGSPLACRLGFLQTPPRGGRLCPAPRPMHREYLARGLAPRSFGGAIIPHTALSRLPLR